MANTIQVVSQIVGRGLTQAVSRVGGGMLGVAAGVALLAGAGLGYAYVKYHQAQVDAAARAAAYELLTCYITPDCNMGTKVAAVSGLSDEVKSAIKEYILNAPSLTGTAAAKLANCVGGSRDDCAVAFSLSHVLAGTDPGVVLPPLPAPPESAGGGGADSSSGSTDGAQTTGTGGTPTSGSSTASSGGTTAAGGGAAAGAPPMQNLANVSPDCVAQLQALTAAMSRLQDLLLFALGNPVGDPVTEKDAAQNPAQNIGQIAAVAVRTAGAIQLRKIDQLQAAANQACGNAQSGTPASQSAAEPGNSSGIVTDSGAPSDGTQSAQNPAQNTAQNSSNGTPDADTPAGTAPPPAATDGTDGNAGTGAGGSNSGQAGPTAYNTPTSAAASDPTAGDVGNYIQQALAALVSALTNNAGNNNTNASTASNPPTQTSGVQPSNNGQAGPTAGNSPNTTIPPLPMVPPLQQGVDCSKVTFPYPTSGPCAVYDAGSPGTQTKTASTSTTTNTTAAAPQQASCPSGYVNWSCKSSQGTTSGCLTPQDAANDTAQYKAMGYTCSTGSQPSPSTPTSTAAAPSALAPNSGASTTPTNIICGYTTVPPGTALAGFSQTFGVAASVCPSSWCLTNGSPPIDTGHGAVVNPSAQCNPNQTKGYFTGYATDLNGNHLPSAVPPSSPLNIKSTTQMASAAQASSPTTQNAPVPACNSAPPFLPWGGSGSATITVSGGKPCGIGWHDTPGGPGGITVIDSMSVTSSPSHGTLTPQDQHVIIFTPTPGYKGQDSFNLSMQEHNGGRSATLRVKVSVTIQ